MAGGAVSGSGSVLDEEAYELEDGSSWGARFPLLKVESTEGETKMRKFDEFSGSEFGPWEYQAEGPEASFYYVGEGGENRIAKPRGGGRYTAGMNGREKFIIGSKEQKQSICELNAGKRISSNCGGYGSRQIPLKLDDEIDFDGGKHLEKMMSYVSKGDAEGIEEMWKRRTIDLEEELFGVFKGRDFWLEKLGEGKDRRINLKISHLGELVSFLSQGEEIFTKTWDKGEIIDGGMMTMVKGKTETLGSMIRKYGSRRNSVEESFASRTKDLDMIDTLVNFLGGREGDVGFSCKGRTGNVEMAKYFEECEQNLVDRDVVVIRVVKTIFAKNDGRIYIPKQKGEDHGDGQEEAFEKETFGWSGGVAGNGLSGVKYRSKEGVMKLILSETCTEDGKDVGTFEVLGKRELKIKSELCKEIIKPGFGDEVSNKRVCYFKFKNGKQNYLRRGNFFNGMLKIPVGYKDAEGYGAKCSVHGI